MQADGKMEQLNQMPLGTGPFPFVAYQPDAVIRYKANPDYWAGKQKIDDLVFAITTDASVRAQKLKANECQIMPYPNAADVEGLKADPNLQVMQQEGLNVAYLAYNTTAGAVRQARGPQGPQHGDQQAGDRRRRLPGRRHAGEEPDPADDVVLQRQHQGRRLRSGCREEDADRRRRHRTFR